MMYAVFNKRNAQCWSHAIPEEYRASGNKPFSTTDINTAYKSMEYLYKEFPFESPFEVREIYIMKYRITNNRGNIVACNISSAIVNVKYNCQSGYFFDFETDDINNAYRYREQLEALFTDRPFTVVEVEIK